MKHCYKYFVITKFKIKVSDDANSRNDVTKVHVDSCNETDNNKMTKLVVSFNAEFCIK